MTQVKDHVVVCGLHGVGLRIVEHLNGAGVPVVVVDDQPDPRLVGIVRSWGVPHLTGSSRLPETLLAAGVNDAAALVCVETDDLHTLETALLARELRPDLRVVVQLRNAAVGRAMTTLDIAVVDVAGLSAPSVVESCLGTGEHAFDLAGREFQALRVVAPEAGTLRALYGDLAPIGVVPGGTRDVVVAPGRDHEVRAGDVVFVVGTPSELVAAGLTDSAERDDVRSSGRRVLAALARTPRQLAASVRQAADRRLWIVVSALGGLLAVSVTVLRAGYREPDGTGMSTIDAVYFTVETIGTVGFGDFYFRDQHQWLRMWAIGLMIVGAMLATVFFALLTNLLVSRRLEESLGRRRVTGLSGHVILIGLGSVGVEVLARLTADGVRSVVVEADEDNRHLAQARSLGVPVIAGDATDAAVLDTAGLSRARAVAALTSDDLVNIETGLAVRDRLGPRWADVPVVLRLFDRQLAATIAKGFDFRHVRSTAALAAPWFVGAALGLDVLSTFYVGDTAMLVARLRVRPDGGLVGVAMQELSARTRVVAIDRSGDGFEHPPRRGTVFRGGDEAYLIGPSDELLQVLRRDQAVS